ncbi:MAG: glycosyltransferase [Proteobacteria bacterium]|nr:glycosyltransferase [Pseudomonadota bacterium]
MEKLHILLVCPDGANFPQLKQAGTLALAMRTAGIKVSLYIGATGASALDGLHPEIKLHYAPMTVGWQFWKDCLLEGFKTLVAQDPTIDVVHLVDVAWPASKLALYARRIRLTAIGRLWDAEALDGHDLSPWQRRQHYKALQNLTPLVVHSAHLLEIAKKKGLNNVVLVPEGIDTEQFKPVLSKRPIRRGLGLPEKATLICCMADISPENNQLSALEKCLPLSEKRQLLLIGNAVDKTYAADVIQAATAKGAGAYVHMLEAVGNPEDYLRACDLFILMGGIENRHATVLEAMSAGLPVILSPAPSALVLTNGNRCGVVLYDDNQLATTAFDKLLNDATYRQGRSMSTRPYVQKNFPFRAMLKAYMKIYNSL